MKILFIEYPKCTTCQKAKKWLTDNKIEFEDRHIVENNPAENELCKWLQTTGYDIKKFFNTSGLKYKELGLKEKFPTLTFNEKLELLASDGMLVKRPILVFEDKVLLGFKEEEWEAYKEYLR